MTKLYKIFLKTVSVLLGSNAKRRFKGLGKIDWLRSNSEWESRVFKEGKIIGKEEGIIRICNLIKLKLGIELSKEELVKENDAR